VADWAQESWALAHDLVYPQVFGHVVAATETTPKEVTLDDKSLDKDAAVAGERIFQAGLRLAKVLDEAPGCSAGLIAKVQTVDLAPRPFRGRGAFDRLLSHRFAKTGSHFFARCRMDHDDTLQTSTPSPPMWSPLPRR
jgi:hypothetical protein